jgi:hypothetical protein
VLRPRIRALFDDGIARVGKVEACLFAIGGDGDVLAVVHATPGVSECLASLLIPIGGGVSGWVAANRSAVWGADPRLDLGDLAQLLLLDTCISTPIFSAMEPFGVLTVYGTEAAQFSENAMRFVGTLAQEIGLAIARGNDDSDESRFVLRRPPVAAVS